MDPKPWSLHALWTLAVRTVADSKQDRVLGLGAEVAFFSILSLPPMLLAVFGTVGFIAEELGPDATEEIRRQVVGVARSFLTPGAVDRVRALIDTFLAEGRAGVASIGLVLALWSASRATNVAIEATNIAYDLEEERSGIRRRALAFGMTVLGILAAVVVLPLLVAGPRLGQYLGGVIGIGELTAQAWRVLYWPAVGIAGVGTLATFYHFAPATPWRTPWRRDVPGAVVAALLWLAGGAGLRLYAAFSITSNGAYETLAAPIVLLLWVYVSAIAVLVGAEVNAEIEKLWPTDERLRSGHELDAAPASDTHAGTSGQP